MPKQIITDVFEQLGSTVKQAGKQIVKLPGEVAETAVEQTGVKPDFKNEYNQPETALEKAQKEQKRRRVITALESELQDIRRQRTQELPKQITGKPGFSEEGAIKQLEYQGEAKKKLPPVVIAAKQKAGTGERRVRGVSG